MKINFLSAIFKDRIDREIIFLGVVCDFNVLKAVMLSTLNMQNYLSASSRIVREATRFQLIANCGPTNIAQARKSLRACIRLRDRIIKQNKANNKSKGISESEFSIVKLGFIYIVDGSVREQSDFNVPICKASTIYNYDVGVSDDETDPELTAFFPFDVELALQQPKPVSIHEHNETDSKAFNDWFSALDTNEQRHVILKVLSTLPYDEFIKLKRNITNSKAR